jgi:PPM family protein phosphatase
MPTKTQSPADSEAQEKTTRPLARAHVEFGACTDVGQLRQNNEDSMRAAPELDLFVLSDGMGGHASGEVASRIAAETVVAHCRDAESNPSLEFVGERVSGASETSNRLASAVRTANRAVYEAAQQAPERHGMGATLVALRFIGDRVSLAHAGDSRAYLLRAGELRQLTEDHSFVAEQVRRGIITAEEANGSPLQNALLRALGVDPEVEVDLEEHVALDGDVFVLCSDGLTNELSNAQIAAVLEKHHDEHAAAERLVALANQAGGHDNVTVFVVRYATRKPGALARLGRWFKDSRD